jgi:phosphoenolpyruvate carboxykinase (GTP)
MCGKTNLAMLRSSLPGWEIRTVGDDIAWMKFGKDGRLHAINPEAGFFGVAPGTSMKSNPYAMQTIERNTLFTNVALTPDGDVWWEGMTDVPPPHLTDWLGAAWTPGSHRLAAHPNARFTVPLEQCPIIDPLWNDPEGVPISGLIFGGRRASLVPLVYETFNWRHGVLTGAAISSETTAAAKGEVGKLRHDPFAMLPFCGYNMGDYFAHWLEMGRLSKHLPKIFHVNWFRKSKEGKWLWPGFGENARILKWMFERVEGSVEAEESPIGYLPLRKDLDLSGLHLSAGALEELFAIDVPGWKKEIEGLKQYFSLFGDKLPKEIKEEMAHLAERMKS